MFFFKVVCFLAVGTFFVVVVVLLTKVVALDLLAFDVVVGGIVLLLVGWSRGRFKMVVALFALVCFVMAALITCD